MRFVAIHSIRAVLALLAATALATTFSGTASAEDIRPPDATETASVVVAQDGDDYPAKWRDADKDSTFDDWGYYNRECTSWVAWALHSREDFEMPWAVGNANQWDDWATEAGYTVDDTPKAGAIAQTDDGDYGHVAYVSEVDGDSVTIEEYNYDGEGHYHSRDVAKSDFTYLHVTKD
jgi:surface antigen